VLEKKEVSRKSRLLPPFSVIKINRAEEAVFRKFLGSLEKVPSGLWQVHRRQCPNKGGSALRKDTSSLAFCLRVTGSRLRHN
jgi:hypothetical protein